MRERQSLAVVPRNVSSGAVRPLRIVEPAAGWADYARIPPGEYNAYCRRARWYWEKGFKRWTCLLQFDVLAADSQTLIATIPMWLNGGDRESPWAGRRSRYFAEWIRANGNPPPRKDRLAPRLFAKRMARVRVRDTARGPLPYSVVSEILEWRSG